MKEMYELMDSVNQWMDDSQGLLNEYKDDMASEEQENLKKRAEVIDANYDTDEFRLTENKFS